MRNLLLSIFFIVTLSHSSEYTLDVNVVGIPDTISDSDSVPITFVVENGTKNTLFYDVYISVHLTDGNTAFNIPCQPTRLEFTIGNKVKKFDGSLLISELYDSILIDTTVLRKADTLKAIDTAGFDKKEKLRHKIEILETFYSSRKKATKKRSVNAGIYTLKIKLMFKDRLACQSDCRQWLEFPFVVVVK